MYGNVEKWQFKSKKKLQQQSTGAVTDKGTTNTCAAFNYYMYTPDKNVYQVTWQQS